MGKIKELDPIELNDGPITDIRWSPDGRLAASTESGSIIIFELETRKRTRQIQFHADVTAIAWSLKAACILAGSCDGSIGVWDFRTESRAPFSVDGHRSAIHSIEWTDEEAYAITCSSDRLRVLDGACLLAGWSREMEDSFNERAAFTAASCSRQSTFLLAAAAVEGKLLRLASLLSGMVLSSIEVESAVRALAWSPVEDLFGVADGEKISLYRCTQDGIQERCLQMTSPNTRPCGLSFSANGNLLASSNDEGIDIWDIRRHERVASNGGRTSRITFHPEQPLLAAAGSPRPTLRLFDLSGVDV